MRSNFFTPILYKSPLGYDENRIHRIGLQPLKSNVYSDLCLPQPLLVKYCRIGKILDRFDSVNLIGKSGVSGFKTKVWAWFQHVNALTQKLGRRPARIDVAVHATRGSANCPAFSATTGQQHRESCSGTSQGDPGTL